MFIIVRFYVNQNVKKKIREYFEIIKNKKYEQKLWDKESSY